MGFGCSGSPSTQVVVLVDTDYAMPVDVDRIRARVAKVVDAQSGTNQAQPWVHVFAVSSGPTDAPGTHALPATFGILPAEGDLSREIIIEVEALAPDEETPLVTRRVRTGFVPGEARLVRMLLHRACAEMTCADGQACGCPRGSSCAIPSCVDEWVAPEHLEPMEDPRGLPLDSVFPVPGDLPDASVPDASIPDASIPDASIPDASIPDASIPDGGEIDCEAPLEPCNFECVDTRSDPRYCGNCATACPFAYECEAGACVDPGDCRTNGRDCAGFTYCDEATGDCLRGCVSDVQCTGDNERCDANAHDCVCTAEFERCMFDCVDTQVDPRFCGDCETSCPSGNVCEVGACVDPGDCRSNGIGCSGFTYCDQATGDCLFGCDSDTQCATPMEICDAALHACVCAPGFHRCGALCASDDDVDSCGASCAPCPVPSNSTPTCDLGTCGFVCADTYVVCGDACCPTSCPPGQVLLAGACASLHIQLASDQGNIGEHSALGVDTTSAAHIGCYTRSGRNLKYIAQQPDGTWVTETADAPNDVGQYTSIAFDDEGDVHIAYYDASAQDLKHATRSAAGTWSIEVVADAGDVGRFASLAFDAAGAAHIAYYDRSTGSLAISVQGASGAWVAQTVEAVDDVGTHASLAFAPTGVAHIAYYDQTNGNLRLAVRQAGGAWASDTVDAVDDVGMYASLAFDPSGVANIAYYDVTNGNLRLATAQEAGPWSIQTVDAVDDVGAYASLAFDAAGLAHIGFYDATAGNLKHATLSPEASWNVEVIDSVGDVGAYASIAVDSDGHTHIGYFDLTNTNLKYALIAAAE